MLRRLVSLPPNSLTQSSLLTLGAIDEKLGEFAKARVDYYTYVTLYPKAKNVEEVRASLMKMVMASYVAEKSVPEKIATENKMITFGGFSQNFYRGLGRVDYTIPIVYSSSITPQSQ